MARVTPEQYAEKWARRTSAAVPDYTAGVQGVTTAPGIAAAKAGPKMLAKITDSVNSGRWAARVGAVSLGDWQRASTEVGAQRLAQGVQAAQPRAAEVARQLLPAVDAARARVQSMPSMSLEDNIARSAAFQREMAKFKLR